MLHVRVYLAPFRPFSSLILALGLIPACPLIGRNTNPWVSLSLRSLVALPSDRRLVLQGLDLSILRQVSNPSLMISLEDALETLNEPRIDGLVIGHLNLRH